MHHCKTMIITMIDTCLETVKIEFSGSVLHRQYDKVERTVFKKFCKIVNQRSLSYSNAP